LDTTANLVKAQEERPGTGAGNIEHSGSERVVRAAGPETKRNPASPFLCKKDKGNLRYEAFPE